MKAVSHMVIATEDVSALTKFFADAFALKPYFENPAFSEFVAPSGFRIALFKPVGESAKRFTASGERGTCGFGITVSDVNQFFNQVQSAIQKHGGSVSGPPKEHPWGEKSFLMLDPDGNRWEIAQSPTESGMLKNIEKKK